MNNNLNKHKCNKKFIQGREQMKVWKVTWPRNYEFANKDHMCLITDISKRINPEMGPRILDDNHCDMREDTCG